MRFPFSDHATHFILQILKEIREEHDRPSDHSTALTPVQLETFASSTCVETKPELMQVKCTSLDFFFYHLSQSFRTLTFSSGRPTSYWRVDRSTSSSVDTAGISRAGSTNGKRKPILEGKGLRNFPCSCIFNFLLLQANQLLSDEALSQSRDHDLSVQDQELEFESTYSSTPINVRITWNCKLTRFLQSLIFLYLQAAEAAPSTSTPVTLFSSLAEGQSTPFNQTVSCVLSYRHYFWLNKERLSLIKLLISPRVEYHNMQVQNNHATRNWVQREKTSFFLLRLISATKLQTTARRVII